MSSKTYDTLKWIAMVVLPAIATLVLTVFQEWGLPYSEPISATIVAISTFLGVILQVSSKTYSGDGVIIIDPSSPETYTTSLSSPVADVAEKSSVVLKVNSIGE